MSRSAILRSTALALVAVSLGACALAPHGLKRHAKWAPTSMITTPQDLAPADGYYYSAKAAIDRRDYAMALDLLQAARSRRPDDVRVLNAFGVVYDKLGRFDLSERYYAQAASLDAGSTIVASNLAYSRELQGLASAEVARPLFASSQLPARPLAPPKATPPAFELVNGPALIATGPNLLRLRLPVSAQPTLKIAAQTGSKLTFVNASGAAGGAELVRVALAARGWTVPSTSVPAAPARRFTTIEYAKADSELAFSLARTLPRPARLIDCGGDCTGVRLEVGMDTANWKFESFDPSTRARVN
jgi:tetratricopeptide (TPR) repeat protein